MQRRPAFVLRSEPADYGLSAIDRGVVNMQAPRMEPLETFAANVKRLRQERKLTQEGLAEKAGLNLTDIARIETMRRDPGVKVAAKIAYGLGVPTSKLFERVKHHP
jgi:DNA-binding XRE family transcriptional regulator